MDNNPTPAVETTTPVPGRDATPLSLTLSSDEASVLATFTPPAAAPQATPAAVTTAAPGVVLVQELLKQGGWADWWVDAPALEKWRQQIPQAKQPLTAAIAHRR